MSIFDKFMFWKKKDDEFNFDSPIGLDSDNVDTLNEPQTPPMDFNQPIQAPQPDQNNYFDQQHPTSENQSMSSLKNNQNMELINAKLDAIKANVETINQRLANLERYMQR